MAVFGLGRGSGVMLILTLAAVAVWAALRQRTARAPFRMVGSVVEPRPHVVVRHVGSGHGGHPAEGFRPSGPAPTD